MSPQKTESPLIENPTSDGQDFDRALKDYHTCRVSRELSNVIRRDVLSGRAKFGVSDDGKELYQVAMARAIEKGDWRADYYRGQTLLLALDLFTVEDILAQLYSDGPNDPFSAGRQMVGHHATRALSEDGNWLDHTKGLNVSSATSPTAGQMARGMGLAFASTIYRNGEGLPEGFSNNGNELCWTEIGDASTSEGVFWEVMNSAGVVQAPMVVTVVDDGYGISVPVTRQTTKGSISSAMAGLQAGGSEKGDGSGIDIYGVRGWDYPALVALYPSVAERVRKTHRAALVHVRELTQPNGHSTSGSHERYKGEERLAWEKEWDCLLQFRHWLLAVGAADAEQLDAIEKQARKVVMSARKNAWEAYTSRLNRERDQLMALLPASPPFDGFRQELGKIDLPIISELVDATRRFRLSVGDDQLPAGLLAWLKEHRRAIKDSMGTHLYSETERSPVRVPATPAHYTEASPKMPAYELLQKYFAAKFEERPELFAFGEDVGTIGDVNQGFAGLQDKFGKLRVFDTGIREWTIIGGAMGMAMRGLRPIVEIQYLDYVFYAMSVLTDDVSTLRWRTAGMQSCPIIVRTRGHRLEGVWHSGSYLSPLIGTLRGMHLCVPRNTVQAAGMYNTLLRGDDPAIVVEVLNAYRIHEIMPDNLASFTVPLGVPECIRAGSAMTIVTYGACVRVCLEAADLLEQRGVQVEIIDAQTLLPFDLEHRIANHLSQTNRLLIVDEDVPGGTSAYLRQQILEVQGGYAHLDAAVRTVTASAHRPPYGDIGNYSSKPQAMDVVEAALELLEF